MADSILRSFPKESVLSRYANSTRSFLYERSSSSSDIAESPEDTRRECVSIPESFGSCGAVSLTIGPELSGHDVKLLADTGLNRCTNDEIDVTEDLRSSREDRRELSVDVGCDVGCEPECEPDENLLRAAGILCVSIAAGGFLLKRLLAFAAVLWFSSSFSFFTCFSRSFVSFSALFFSFLFLPPPNCDQLGDWQISSSSDASFADELSSFRDDDRSFSCGGIKTDKDGIVCDLVGKEGRGGEVGSNAERRDLPRFGLLSTEDCAAGLVALSAWGAP